jgi:hypothetical protein
MNLNLAIRCAVAAFALVVVGSAVAEDLQELPMVPPAGPGVFTVKDVGPNAFLLTVKGSKFSSRGEVEKYLAYRAARLTIEKEGTWFTLTENRGEGDTAEPVPQRDPNGQRYSFRMNYFRPVWRVQLDNSSTWTRWSPFSGKEFPESMNGFEASIDIVVRKAPMDDADPLAFEAWALSDLLINQVSPPE